MLTLHIPLIPLRISNHLRHERRVRPHAGSACPPILMRARYPAAGAQDTHPGRINWRVPSLACRPIGWYVHMGGRRYRIRQCFDA
ncbi:hypothetical protein EVAR_2810_1 [Eumeta japonica]|uniref:Uncharacterized protein n=1 Tax=Eumeta variegata TaxID=151549 RepID=A0A4C1SZR7_EUMVA|nr:hypothetical protein EVAR_2810_1 [Eumeta japonica]